ncbi:MAG: pantoate--beta-alanine ligase [Bacteroidota bacterium]
MHVFENPVELRTKLRSLYCENFSIGFVPTMGALHDGHGSLIRRAAQENDYTVVSIFVNPTQFGPNEDLDKYPRTLQADLDLCREMGATHIFTPTVHTIYPEGRDTYQVQFSLRSLDKILCGAKRPGHFDGVLQVVSKLFNIVQPTRAYFGLKDYQQLTILRTLARELFFPIEIVPCDIIRETDGLAMSSRNRYLNPQERRQALFLSRCLKLVQEKAQPGLAVHELEALVHAQIANYSLIRLDYFDLRNGHDLSEIDVLRPEDAPRGIIAAFCGNTRLIDNMPVFV